MIEESTARLIAELELTLGDAMCRELYETFVETTDGELEALRGAVAADDPKETVARAHSIRGSAANLDASGLSDAAGGLEAAARDGALPADASDQVAAIERAYRPLRRYLRAKLGQTSEEPGHAV